MQFASQITNCNCRDNKLFCEEIHLMIFFVRLMICISMQAINNKADATRIRGGEKSLGASRLRGVSVARSFARPQLPNVLSHSAFTPEIRSPEIIVGDLFLSSATHTATSVKVHKRISWEVGPNVKYERKFFKKFKQFHTYSFGANQVSLLWQNKFLYDRTSYITFQKKVKLCKFSN